jgi:hypothetical protein
MNGLTSNFLELFKQIIVEGLSHIYVNTSTFRRASVSQYLHWMLLSNNLLVLHHLERNFHMSHEITTSTTRNSEQETMCVCYVMERLTVNSNTYPHRQTHTQQNQSINTSFGNIIKCMCLCFSLTLTLSYIFRVSIFFLPSS